MVEALAKMETGKQAGVGSGKVDVRVEVSGEVLRRLLSKEEGEEIFGLLKGWKVDPQRLKDELREED